MRKPASATREPKRNSQKASAFRRGNATSGAPICSGIITLAKPANSGVANISSITVPCMVNSWLYCSLVCRNCIPGSKSSARMISAMTPPMQKNRKELIRYMYPMTLWSVVVSQLTTTLPFETGTARETARESSVVYSRVVMLSDPLRSESRGHAGSGCGCTRHRGVPLRESRGIRRTRRLPRPRR